MLAHAEVDGGTLLRTTNGPTVMHVGVALPLFAP